MGRTRVNALSFGLTSGVLLLIALAVGRGDHASGIQRMTTDIHRALKKVLQQLNDIQYDEMVYSEEYGSSVNFHPKGMNILYNTTNTLTKFLFPKVIPDELVVTKNGLHISQDNYAGVVRNYIPFLSFLGALLLFAVLMPLCGFCFCSWRCCCGSRKTKSIEKNRELCKKVLYATLMIGMGTLLLFGVVCAFVSNEQMQAGTNDLTGNLHITITDTQKYFKETKKHVNLLLNRNFQQLSNVLMKTLNDSTTILYNQLKNITQASSIDDALQMVDTMNKTQNNLNELKALTNILRAEASQLDDAMRRIKRDLIIDLNKCNTNPICSDMRKDYVDRLGTAIDFNSIPDISNEIKTINEMMMEQGGLIRGINAGKQQLHNLKLEIERKVGDNIRTIELKVKDAGKEIERQSNDVNESIDEALNEIVKVTKEGLDVADGYIVEYSKYRYFVGLGVSCVFLLLTMFIALGLICGICGKKPTYGDDCCNKAAGSRFLMCGVCIMFLTSFLLVVILLVHILAMVVQIMVCEPIRNPDTSETMLFYDENIDFKQLFGVDIKLKKMIISCYMNESAYQVFNLESKFNINEVREYVTKFDIDKKLEELEKNMELNTSSFELLSAGELDRMVRLGADLHGIHNTFERIMDEIKIDDFTTVSLDELLGHLYAVIVALKSQRGNSEIVTSLELSHMQLETYIEKLFNPMVANANKTLELAQETNEALKFGYKDFNTAITTMAKQIQAAQTDLQQRGAERIKDVINVFATGLKQVLQAYLDRITTKIATEVGKCGPLALVLNGTLTSTCDKIILPMAGFGVSILWCILLFIPTIVFSVTLADLYRKTDNGYMEAEYLYDAYADRENISLARGNYSGKKKHTKKRYEGRGYLTEADAARGYPSSSQHHNEARYSDMAPKHYEDFPNGGPPQYHRATEYERPPPYYCPESTDH